MTADPSTATVATDALTSLFAFARRCGLDGEALYRDHGWELPVGDRVPLARVMVLRRLLAEAAGDPDLGVRLADVLTFDDFGLMGARARVSAHLGDALQTIATFLPLWQEGASISLHERPDATEVAWTPPVGFDPVGTFVDAQETILGIARLPELLDGRREPGIVVQLPRLPARPGPGWLQALTLRTGPGWWVRFPSELVQRPRAVSAPVRQALEAAASAALEARPDTDPLLDAVARALGTRPMAVGLDAVARRLGRSRRSLQRDLAARDTSFRDLRDSRARVRAEGLLAHSDDGLDTIAEAVGFATTPAFVRAFRRWTGESPGAWRRTRATEG